jgi:hypothetical protein
VKILGIILLVAGVMAFSYGGFSYMRTAKVVDAGPVQLSSHWRENVPLPPVVGITMGIAGAVLILSANRRRTA